MASLLFQAGPNAGRRYKLGDGDYIIGRRSDCQIFVPDMRVSRQHARLHQEDGRWCIEDLGSNNGTYINGQRIQSSPLADQDEISIANNRIRVDLPNAGRNPNEYDAHVTIVDLKDPRVYMASEDSSDARFFNASLAGVQDSQREHRLLERKLTALQSILESAATAANADEIIASLVSKLLDLFPVARSVGVLVEEERTKTLKVHTHKHRTEQSSSELEVPGTIIRHVLEDGRGILLQAPGLAGNGRPTSDGDGTDGDGSGPAGSRMGAPLKAQGKRYGVLYVEGEGRTFRQEDVDLLTSVAAQAGLAIHAARMHQEVLTQQRLERDLRVARQLQRSLLPAKPPEVVGLEFAVHYEPAYQIGGDFYDFIWHHKSHLGIVVGDVAGKAISAALYMASLTSQLRSRAAIAQTPARLLRRVNEEMLQLGDDGMFATLAYLIYDLDSRTLVFTNAGHVVPLLRRDGRVYPLHAERAHVAPIGIMPAMEVGEARVQLHSGDLLVLTTDGIHEARDAAGNEYGLKRLSRRIRSARGGPGEIIKAILQDVDSHVASGSQGDDITIVTMSVGRVRARRRTDTIPGIHQAPQAEVDGEPMEESGETELPESDD